MRQTSLFNKALLAKQGWTILTKPQSIIAKLFKEIYFLGIFFLVAKLGSKPSPYWRGLIWGRELLSIGVGWKIGDGFYINLRSDNWF